MADTTTTTTAHSLKLFVATRTRRVLFAEASRDVVDFLFFLLDSASLRLEDATRHGCVGNLYDSADALAAKPRTCACHHCRRKPPAPAPGQHAKAERFFLCSDRRGDGCDGYVTGKRGARCPSCGGRMAAAVPPGAPGAGGSGSGQKAALMCMLKDDLTVARMPGKGDLLALAGTVFWGDAASAAFRGAPAFQETTVRLGDKEGLEILQASLRSSTVLTDVFLRDKAVAIQLDRVSNDSPEEEEEEEEDPDRIPIY